MTSKEIDEMAAGPEMDRLVAEKVMGWANNGGVWSPRSADGCPVLDVICADMGWSPSKNVVTAWEVVRQMARRGAIGFVLENSELGSVIADERPPEDLEYGECWEVFFELQGELGDFDVAATGPTAPLAICRAALKTMMKGEGSHGEDNPVK